MCVCVCLLVGRLLPGSGSRPQDLLLRNPGLVTSLMSNRGLSLW